ncbi:hypothetical protein AYX14_07153 [Cryptococcus neoformans]|nr:hypothetical protein AYX14_07153 [Cryptococcus neoformans var. grubii]
MDRRKQSTGTKGGNKERKQKAEIKMGTKGGTK